MTRSQPRRPAASPSVRVLVGTGLLALSAAISWSLFPRPAAQSPPPDERLSGAARFIVGSEGGLIPQGTPVVEPPLESSLADTVFPNVFVNDPDADTTGEDTQ